jgi:hypothetical protein
MRWGWERGLCKVPAPPALDKQPCLPRPDPAARRPSPLPKYVCLCAFIFPLMLFRGSGGGSQSLPCVAGGPVCVLSPHYGFS